MPTPILTLAHSPDPDDAFMWWPITGKVRPDATPLSSPDAAPRVDTGRFSYRAIPADIEALNRAAVGLPTTPLPAPPPFDVTALSFRAWCDARHHYVLAACGSSFGENFGPKVVARLDQSALSATVNCEGCLRDPDVAIAIPGLRTTAALVLAMILGKRAVDHKLAAGKLVELPFHQIIPAVATGQVHAGLVIHEGQVLYEQAGLKLITDLGVWWSNKTGLPLPLGANAIRRDLDQRFGPGSVAEVAATLARSLDFALAHRHESLEYTLPFALANTTRSGQSSGEPPTLARVDRYVHMYVNRWTINMGREGQAAVRRLLDEGAALNLCPNPGPIDVVGL